MEQTTHLVTSEVANFQDANPAQLCIYQCNAHRSRITHHSILNNSLMENFDLLMIVEPYTYTQDEQHTTLIHCQWQLILPGLLMEATARPCSIIYVNTRILSMSYFITPSPSRDIALISFQLPDSAQPLTFVNIYNPLTTFTTIPAIAEVVDLNPMLFSPEAAFISLGDFNLHHPLWNDPALEQASHHEADTLLDIMTTIGAQLRSQPAIHTYHNSQGASSVIDLVFTSTMADRLYEKCITSHDSDFNHGSDHYPILHCLTLAILRVNPPPRFNWKTTDWARIIASTKWNLRSWLPPQAHAQSINR